ncbi:MAG: 8-amino-7-oxononanoate synthase [Fibrobacteria bacterium]|nr:8-amino-7-oxononanoate synthase [Fibrobacteria bacterium]
MNCFNKHLISLKAKDCYRSLLTGEQAPGKFFTHKKKKSLNLVSNNYLGLASHPLVKQAAAEAVLAWGAGSSGSRLLGGSLTYHKELEEKLAGLHRSERALLFNSGYAANTGILQTISSCFSQLFCDRLNHASIIDGMLLGKTAFTRYRHLDMNHLESLLKKQAAPEKCLVISETLFSMEGDFLPLEEMLVLQAKYHFYLYLDEAHSFGGYPDYLEPAIQQGYERMLVIGTFGKALGGFGAFAAGSHECIDFLVNTSRSFIFSTALPAAVIAGASAALDVCANEEWRVHRLHTLTSQSLDTFRENNFNTGASASHIIPVIIGGNEDTLRVAAYLQDNGMYALPIRYPTVPKGLSRLRLCLNCELASQELEPFFVALQEALRK